MKEYDRFEKGAANSNTSTAILKKQLEDSNAHIIITTIQKLATFIKKNKEHEVYRKTVSVKNGRLQKYIYALYERLPTCFIS